MTIDNYIYQLFIVSHVQGKDIASNIFLDIFVGRAIKSFADDNSKFHFLVQLLAAWWNLSGEMIGTEVQG